MNGVLMQVSGRAGRRNKRGRVLLQTAHPGHPVIAYIALQSSNFGDLHLLWRFYSKQAKGFFENDCGYVAKG